MTHDANQWKRDTRGLRQAAQQKAAQTRRRAEEAIALLLKERRPINFKAVAATAHVSTAWLYAQEDIKQRILHLREQQTPRAQVKIPPREQASSASKDAMIAALQLRVKAQAEEIKELKKQLEVAYRGLYTR